MDDAPGQGIARTARTSPGKPAMIFGDAVRTYGELDRRVNQMAHALRRAGIGEGAAAAGKGRSAIRFHFCRWGSQA